MDKGGVEDAEEKGIEDVVVEVCGVPGLDLEEKVQGNPLASNNQAKPTAHNKEVGA